MSTADKLAKVLETKLNIKQAITEKGVSVLDTDTFASYPDKIRAISGGGSGGGDKIFVENSTGSEINSGDKVLVQIGLKGGETGNIVDHTSTSYYYDSGELFTDNENAFILFKSSDRKYTAYNDSWTSVSVSNWKLPSSAGITFFKNGVVCLDGKYTGGNSNSAILTNSTSKKLPDFCKYLGEYNGVKYCVNSDVGDIFTYNDISNTAGTEVKLNAASNTFDGYIDEETGKGFLATRGNLVDFIYIAEDGIFKWNGSIKPALRDSAYLVTYTGCDVGDYFFYGTNYEASYNATKSNSVSQMIVYKVVDNGSGGRTLELQDTMFKAFQIQDCFIQFDMRNDVLTVGTRDNVYTYKFDRQGGYFKDLGLSFELPETTGTYAYRLVYSPDMVRAMITVRTTYALMNTKFYSVASADRKVVTNETFNYNPSNTFTGIATGNVDDLGRYEVEMILPEKLDLKVATDVNVADDEIVFEGME